MATGHPVTLFATADCLTTATLSATVGCGWSEDDGIDAKVAECVHIASVFERADEFDVIHNGFDFLPLTYYSVRASSSSGTETVATPIAASPIP